MGSPAAGRRFSFLIGGCVLLGIGLVAVAAGLLISPPPSDSSTHRLIRVLSQKRPGGGRLFHASADPADERQLKKALVDAALYLIRDRDSPAARQLSALVDANTGQPRNAAKKLQSLVEENPNDAGLLNDLGVVYLSLGEEDAVYYFRALDLFERSKRLRPLGPAPQFNLVQTYRKVELRDFADQAMSRYERIEAEPLWIRELSDHGPTDALLVAWLKHAISTTGNAAAVALIEQHYDAYRRLALDYALNPSNTDQPDAVMEFVLGYLANTQADRTIRAILDPLHTTQRKHVLEVRRLIHRGFESYRQSRITESLQLYDLAEAAAADLDSPFDRLWIQLRKADAKLRQQQFEQAHLLADGVIRESRRLNFQWLVGLGLSTNGAPSPQMKSNEEILPILEESIDILLRVRAPEDAARPMNYLATMHSIAGDSEKCLHLIYQSLRFTNPEDHLRLAQFYWLAGLQLYRMGFERYATTLEHQAIDEAKASKNDALISF